MYRLNKEFLCWLTKLLLRDKDDITKNPTSGTKIFVLNYWPMFSIRIPKPSSGKETKGASSTGSQHVEKCKLIHSLFVQVSSPSGSRTATYN